MRTAFAARYIVFTMRGLYRTPGPLSTPRGTRPATGDNDDRPPPYAHEASSRAASTSALLGRRFKRPGPLVASPPRRKPPASTGPRPDALDELLRDRPTDEKQGATATQGFSFQQWWATLAVAELLATKDDFAVGMEVKEDVALLDSATKPTKVEFCQVKKSEQVGAWTLKDLHKKGTKLKAGGHQPSTLAKLYKRRHEFKGHPTKLRFVSNVGFKVPAEDDSNVHSVETKLDQLTVAQQTVVKSAIAEQVGIDAATMDLTDVRLHKTNLPLAEQELFIGGKLSHLVENGLLPFPIAQPTVAARFLASELQSKAANTSYARSLSELNQRLLSRADALNTLARVSTGSRTVHTVLDEAIEHLRAEGHPFLAVKAVAGARVQLCADAADRTNLLFRNLAGTLLDFKDATVASAPEAKLGELMNSLVAGASGVAPAEFAGRDRGYVNALALLVLNDGIDIDVLTAPTGSEPKATK